MKTFFAIIGGLSMLVLIAFIILILFSRAPESISNDQESLKANAIKVENRENNIAIECHKIRVGMNCQDVLRSLGKPDSIDNSPPADIRKDVKQIWLYGDTGFVSFGWDDTVNVVSNNINFNHSN